MASKKLKFSLLVSGFIFIALVFSGALFFADTNDAKIPADNHIVDSAVATARLTIDFGGGEIKNFKIEPRGENLFILTRNKLSEEGIDMAYKTYEGLGDLIIRIGDKESGGGKYWQYWVNGNYAQVGTSSYSPKSGDLIEWKFAD
jgi:hypothetical protein